MRAAPALQVTVRRFGLWRGALALTCAAAAAAVVAWLQAPAAAVAAGALAGAAVSLWRTRREAQHLGWDGESWRFAAADAAVDTRPVVALQVMVDLGAFVLLRIDRADAPPAWLPLQRAGLEPQWHALRCALYSPRPAAASVPPDDPVFPA